MKQANELASYLRACGFDPMPGECGGTIPVSDTDFDITYAGDIQSWETALVDPPAEETGERTIAAVFQGSGENELSSWISWAISSAKNPAYLQTITHK